MPFRLAPVSFHVLCELCQCAGWLGGDGVAVPELQRL
jgi:hypothetical protein